jgi:hypothetical protein
MVLLSLCALCSPLAESAAPIQSSSNPVQADSVDSVDYTKKIPLSAEEFWQRVLSLLNEHNGTVTRQHFEEVFDIHFGPADRQGDATVYRVRQGEDWYFGATFIEFNETYKSVEPSVKDGAHALWSLSWKANSFGDPTKGECITAARVKKDFTATGWTSPWPSWGTSNPPPFERSRNCGDLPCSQSLAPPPVLNFRRQRAADASDWSLPRGSLVATGNGPESCVTNIAFRALN